MFKFLGFNAARQLKEDNDFHERMLVLGAKVASYTPDVLDIFSKYAHNVFVYNECQTGQRAHKELGEHAYRLSAAFTESRNLVLMKKMLGHETFPFAMNVEEDQRFGDSSFYGKPARILGQLFSMRPKSLMALDTYVLNTVQFERVRVQIQVPYREKKDGKEHGPMLLAQNEAWMYIGKHDFWDFMLNKKLHRPTKLYTAKNGEEDLELQYYYFNEQFENSSQ